MRYHILYNPLAGHGGTEEMLERLKSMLDGECITHNITEIKDYKEHISSLKSDDSIVISGGDGTLNKFINSIDPDSIDNDVLYYASGSGNDFYHDIKGTTEVVPFKINKYIKYLPTVTVNGESYRFLNGIGFGIDGYACAVGDKLKAEGKAVNYTSIAIKGLLFDFKPCNARVNIDGKEMEFKKVWIAPTMNGRCYGGGMIPAPEQDRLGDGQVSFVAFAGSSNIRTLTIFPSIFKGEHVKHTKYVTVVKGRNVTVTFDRPCALQIDGETITDVTSYTVKVNR